MDSLAQKRLLGRSPRATNRNPSASRTFTLIGF
jgi:hypothetical protein